MQLRTYKLVELPGGGYRYDNGTLALTIGPRGTIQLASPPPRSACRVDMGRVYMLVTLLRGISNSSRVHAINTRLLFAAEPA
jgi:hypothetical protein